MRLARAASRQLALTPASQGVTSALTFFARLISARAVVEIGTGAGVSGLALLRGMASDGILTSIDLETEHQVAARQIFAAEGVPPRRARLIAGSALNVLPKLTDGAYDIVYVDGDPLEYVEYVAQAQRLLRRGGLLVLHHALWQGLVTAMELPPYLVPSPILMMKTLFTDWATLGGSLWVTVKITVLAFVVATVAGVLISFLFVQSKRIETALFPYAVLLQVTPIVAVAPLIIIWVKDPTASMVICAALVALFPIISNTTLGLRSVEPDLQSYFQLNRATRLQTLLRLRIPSALPYFFGGLRISSGLALIGAVVAEFVAGTGGQGAGLAYQILQAGFQLNIPRMFAALLLISLTGVALFVLMAWLTRVALGGWHASETSHD